MVIHKLGITCTCVACGNECDAKLVRHPSQRQNLIYWQCDCCDGNMRLRSKFWESHSILQANGYRFEELPVGVAYKVVTA